MVEVAVGAGVMAVRDSKDPDGARLVFGRRAWSAFLTTVHTSHLGSTEHS